jgi:hypothetical protein
MWRRDAPRPEARGDRARPDGQRPIHGGPDGDGVLIQGWVGLGSRRPAIIDVEHGAQPLADEQGDAAWPGDPLLPFVRATLARLDPYVFRREAVRALLDEHLERRRDNRRELRAVLVLQLGLDRGPATWQGTATPGSPTTHVVDPSLVH